MSALASKFIKKSALVLLAAGIVACNNHSANSNVKVAGGADDSGANAQYPATMYVVMTGTNFQNQPMTISNVGTFVDVGLPDKLALILSLKDVFVVNASGKSALPVFKTMNISIYPASGQSPITFPGLAFQQDGSLQQASTGKSYAVLSVGLKVDKVGNSNGISDADAANVINKIFLEDRLTGANGMNLRDPQSSYQMILFSKSANPIFASLVAPKLIAPNQRAGYASRTLKMVGFGETGQGSARSGAFLSASTLPQDKKRNAASVSVLSSTPFGAITGSGAAGEQLWEVGGSGLCGSPDGNNYDTGAAIYSGGEKDAKVFLGFAVASTTISSGYKGKLNCGSTAASDMASIVVSPSAEAIQKLLSLQGMVK